MLVVEHAEFTVICVGVLVVEHHEGRFDSQIARGR
jgi:hypothetical protein